MFLWSLLAGLGLDWCGGLGWLGRAVGATLRAVVEVGRCVRGFGRHCRHFLFVRKRRKLGSWKIEVSILVDMPPAPGLTSCERALAVCYCDGSFAGSIRLRSG
jgi:hypothetical protein